MYYLQRVSGPVEGCIVQPPAASVRNRFSLPLAHPPARTNGPCARYLAACLPGAAGLLPDGAWFSSRPGNRPSRAQPQYPAMAPLRSHQKQPGCRSAVDGCDGGSSLNIGIISNGGGVFWRKIIISRTCLREGA
jgi:hypothetical protein